MMAQNEQEGRTKELRMGTEALGCSSVASEQLKGRKQVEGIVMINKMKGEVGTFHWTLPRYTPKQRHHAQQS